MSFNVKAASEFYRIARGRKPAEKMLVHLAIAMTAIVAWTALTPYAVTVVNSVKIVPLKDSKKGLEGSLMPGCSVSGRVIEVAVRELQDVNEGDILIRVDAHEFTLRKKAELARMQNINREIEANATQSELAKASWKSQRAELLTQLSAEKHRVAKLTRQQSIRVKRIEGELDRVGRELKRSTKLVAQKAISQSELDTLRAEYAKFKQDLALEKLPPEQSRIAEFEAQLDSLDASYQEVSHQNNSELLALKNRLSIARNEIEILDWKIGQCSVVAPSDGSISSCTVRVGDWVSPGAVGVTVSRHGLMAEALLPSQYIGDVKPGDKATIMLDGIDWLMDGSLQACVAEISTELHQEEMAQGDGSSRVIDGYRVWLAIEPNEDFSRWESVRLGMTGQVEIQTGEKQLAIYLLEKAVGRRWLP